MDEIHIGVGFEKVAPCALARMRLSRDEEHAQLLADALDGDDRAVVRLGEFVRKAVHVEFDDVRAAMIDAHLDRERLARADRLAHELLAVPAHRDHCGARAAAFQHLRADRLVLADDAEAGRLEELDLAVALVGAPGHERVQRRAEAEALDGSRDVVHDAVRDHHDAGEAIGRDVGKSVGERREEARAVVASAVIGLR